MREVDVHALNSLLWLLLKEEGNCNPYKDQTQIMMDFF